MKTTRWKRSTATVLLAALLSQGCAGPGARLQYLIGEDKTVEHYRDYATAIEYPTEAEARESDPNLFRAPRRITSLEEVSQRHIKLDECIKMALSNSTILRDDQSFGSPGNALLANPSRVASVYDAAIQETSFLFGNRGVDAALADFDPILVFVFLTGGSRGSGGKHRIAKLTAFFSAISCSNCFLQCSCLCFQQEGAEEAEVSTGSQN